MTLTQIYDRIEDLLETMRNSPEDQDCLYNCEMELSYLEQLREDLEDDLELPR